MAIYSEQTHPQVIQTFESLDKTLKQLTVRLQKEYLAFSFEKDFRQLAEAFMSYRNLMEEREINFIQRVTELENKYKSLI